MESFFSDDMCVRKNTSQATQCASNASARSGLQTDFTPKRCSRFGVIAYSIALSRASSPRMFRVTDVSVTAAWARTILPAATE